MFASAALMAAILLMKFAPESPFGRFLNAALVERPLAKLAGMDRRQVVFLMILVGITLFATDTVFMFGSFDLLTLYAWDLTVYLDTMVIASALTALALGRSVLRWLALSAPPLRRGGRPRARRTRAVADKPDSSANDDDPAPAWSLAA